MTILQRPSLDTKKAQISVTLVMREKWGKNKLFMVLSILAEFRKQGEWSEKHRFTEG